MCMKKSKLSSRIVAMILSALTSPVSVGAMFESPGNHESEQYEFDNETNPEYGDLEQKLAVDLDCFKKKVNNAGTDDLVEELQYVENLQKFAEESNDSLNLNIFNNDINQKMELINDRSRKLQRQLDIAKRCIKVNNLVYDEEENEEENNDLHSLMRADESDNLNVPNQNPSSENIQLDQLDPGSIIKEASSNLADSTKLERYIPMGDSLSLNNLDESANIFAEKLIENEAYDSAGEPHDSNESVLNGIQILEGNRQFANNTLNNVVISNDQSGSVIHEDGFNLGDGEEKSPNIDENANIAADEAERDDEPDVLNKLVFNGILEGNEQIANNTLNNVGTSNNQYSNEVISSNAHAEDYSAYRDYVTSEFVGTYNLGEAIIGTLLDKDIEKIIMGIHRSYHDYSLFRIKVGDTIVGATVTDRIGHRIWICIDTLKLYQEIHQLLSQWGRITPCILDAIMRLARNCLHGTVEIEPRILPFGSGSCYSDFSEYVIGYIKNYKWS